MTLHLDLNDDQARRLEEAASRLKVSLTELARAAIDDLLSRQDDDFERITNRVLEKNADLYRRLA